MSNGTFLDLQIESKLILNTQNTLFKVGQMFWENISDAHLAQSHHNEQVDDSVSAAMIWMDGRRFSPCIGLLMAVSLRNTLNHWCDACSLEFITAPDCY